MSPNKLPSLTLIRRLQRSSLQCSDLRWGRLHRRRPGAKFRKCLRLRDCGLAFEPNRDSEEAWRKPGNEKAIESSQLLGHD